MLIRSTPGDVFQALVDPAITSKFWFTKSTGTVVEDAELTWMWEMYGLSSTVTVQQVEESRLVRFTWSGYNPERPTTVEFRLTPWKDNTTYVVVTETGFTGDGDTVVRYATDSTGGFTFVLSALKALLEHGIVLGVVRDAHPSGLEL
jgi:uncharacterized protein YndB with AHSA1/START domain